MTLKRARSKLLLVDDDAEFLKDAELILGKTFDCVTAERPDEVLGACSDEHPDAVLLDLYFDREPLGFEILSDIHEEYPFLPVIMWTQEESIESALEAQARGAFHYVRKTAKASDVLLILDAALRHRQVLLENRALREEVERSWGEFVYASDVIGRLFANLDTIAREEGSVLLTGETGVGKGLLAREIHRRSPRAKGPSVTVECTTLPETLVESELFGHERGAFTEAFAQKIGRCETADGGTLFLDEIADVPLAVQAKLRRLVDEKTFSRVGDTTERKVDARIIVATNQDIERAIADGRFLRDLEARLRIFPIHIPPLRERRDDIVALAEHFLSRQSESRERTFRLSDRSRVYLRSLDWPGNTRELKIAVERACALSDHTTLTPADFPPRASGIPAPVDYREAKERVVLDFKRRFVADALRRHDGDVAKAAAEAGVSRQAFYRFMKEVGVGEEDSEGWRERAGVPAGIDTS